MFDKCPWCWTVSVRLIWSEITLQATLHAVTAAHATQIGPIIATLLHKGVTQRRTKMGFDYVGMYCTLPNFTNLNDLTMSLTSIKHEVKAARLYQCRSPRSWQRWQTQQTDWKTLAALAIEILRNMQQQPQMQIDAERA